MIDSGVNVLKLEAAAMQLLSQSLTSEFYNAVDLLSKCKGKIVLTGMGKSGHISQKIAATFCSTGSPAQYIHPAEASHGDLGNISRDDVVIILSNSGETLELYNIISFSNKMKLPVVSISGKIKSTLSENSTINLVIPNVKEACPNGLAPTTSTTLMLGLGDALCVALMEKKKFTKDDFLEFHPGGNLGAKLKPISAIMHTGDSLPLIQTGSMMSEALIEMTRKGFGIVGVVSKNKKLTGVISDGDLRRNMEKLLDKDVTSVMTKSPVILKPKTKVADALNIMNKHKITSVFVVKENLPKLPIGIVHLHDCLRLENE